MAAVIVAVTTLTVDWVLRGHVGFAVSRPLLFLTLTLTGWAPALELHPLFANSGFAFLAALVVIRWKASPVSATSPARWPWKLLLALLFLSALLIYSYTTFHPLRTTGLGGGTGGAMALVRNNGLGTVTLIGSDTPATVWPSPHRHLTGVILRRHATLTLSFRAQCPPAVVHLRYRLFGRIWSEPISLPMSCP